MMKKKLCFYLCRSDSSPEEKKERPDFQSCCSVVPNLGIMLPYAPLHHLLLENKFLR